MADPTVPVPSGLLEKINKTLDDLVTFLKTGKGGGNVNSSGKLDLTAPNAQAIFKDAGSALKDVASYGLDAGATLKAIGGQKQPVLEAFQAISSIVPGLKNKFASEAVAIIKDSAISNQNYIRQGGTGEFLRQREQETRSAVPYEELNKVLQKSTGSQFAGGVQDERINNMQKVLAELRRDNPRFANDPETLANALVLSMQRNPTINLASETGQRQAAANAKALADEFDKVAIATGKDRTVVAQATMDRLAESKQQAILASLRTDAEKQAYIRTQAATVGFGKDIQDLASDIAAYGGATMKTAGTQAAMGESGILLEKGLKNLSKATNDHEKQLALADIETAKRMYNERVNSKEFADMALAAELFPEEAELLGAYSRAFGPQGNALAGGQAYVQGRGATAEEAQGIIGQEISNVQSGKTTKGATTADLQLQNSILIGNVNAANMAADAMKGLNIQLNKSPAEIKALSDALKLLTPSKSIPKTEEEKKKEEKKKEENKTQPNTESEPPLPNPKLRKDQKRELGTLGTLGQTFEPKDMIALLHKGERVLNPKENADFNSLFGALKDFKPKSEAAIPTATATPVETGDNEPNLASLGGGITLKDLHDSLEQLNKGIMTMVGHTSEMKEHTRETADMSGKMTGNRLAV